MFNLDGGIIYSFVYIIIIGVGFRYTNLDYVFSGIYTYIYKKLGFIKPMFFYWIVGIVRNTSESIKSQAGFIYTPLFVCVWPANYSTDRDTKSIKFGIKTNYVKLPNNHHVFSLPHVLLLD